MILKEFLIVIPALLMTFGVVLGQDVDNQVKSVYMKDGSILNGKIIEDSDYYLRLEINTGDTLKLGYKYIESVGKSSALDAGRIGRIGIQRKQPYHENTGFFALAQGSIFKPHENSGDVGYGFTLTVGKRLSKKWNAGVGVGYFDLHDLVVSIPEQTGFIGSRTDLNRIPVYAYGRYYLNQNRNKLYVSSQLGYALHSGTAFGNIDMNGGLYAKPSIGMHFANRNNAKFLVEIGAMFNSYSGTLSNDFNTGFLPFNSSFSGTRTNLTLTFGVEF